MEENKLLQDFMERHGLSDQSVKKAGSDIARESEHKRPPVHRKIPTCPPHLQRTNRNFFGGEKEKGGEGNER